LAAASASLLPIFVIMATLRMLGANLTAPLQEQPSS
jgi:hypothetical protein